MQDITRLSGTAKEEIARYIKRDNLDAVNKIVKEVHVKNTFYTRYGKRLLDILVSLVALIITLPINLLLAIITFFDVGQPIMFKQERLGKDEKKFIMYKFRNMTNETDVNGELLSAEERVTKWGRFARKTSLDELLNFWSVLKGDMSIVGPRAIGVSAVWKMSDRHKVIYTVLPGLECPMLHRVDHALSWQERFDNYVWYVENCSLWIDICLMFRIVQLAFDKKSTAQRSKACNGGFLGYDSEGKVIYTKKVPDKYVQEYCYNHGFVTLEDALQERGYTILKTQMEEKKTGAVIA